MGNRAARQQQQYGGLPGYGTGAYDPYAGGMEYYGGAYDPYSCKYS